MTPDSIKTLRARNRSTKSKAEYAAYMRQWSTRQYRKLRAQAVTTYGSKCEQCGFSDVRALQFDHLKSNGANHRKRRSGLEILIDVLLFREYFQLLCANCNYIKRVEYGEAPVASDIV